jgi:hypothetical protein|tara:strand:+ start:19 stop:474 length:456 start_codon:yes stop_codon:yes gene_type:complete
MSGFYSGKEGELFIDGTKVAKVRSWSFSMNQAVLETVSLEDTDRTIIHGTRSYTGSASVYYYQETAGGGAGQLSTLINNIIRTGSTSGGDGTTDEATAVLFTLRIKDGSTLGRVLTFQAIPTSFAITSAVGEVTAADISFEVNGAPTVVVL